MTFSRKILCLILSILLTFGLVFLSACTNENVRGGVEYNGVWVVGSENGLTSAVIEDGAVGIKTGAFLNNDKLTELKIPKSITTVMAGAFEGCDALIEKVGGVMYVDNWVVGADRSYTELTVRDGTVGIADEAFFACGALERISLPTTVENIGKRAFYGCDALVEMTLPFAGSSRLGTINTHFGYIFGASSNDNNAEYTPKTLKTVNLTTAVKIDAEAFRGCDSIAKINLPDTVTSIGASAFRGCTALNEIRMSSAVTEIGEYAFYACHGLLDITIPAGVKVLEKFAFTECKSLTSVVVPSSVTVIKACVFGNCENLVSITLPDTLTYIGQEAIRGCNFLEEITIPTSNDELVLGPALFKMCESLKTVTLGDNVVEIGEEAFYQCRSLKTINAPKNLRIVGIEAFSQCQSLTGFQIGEGVEVIGAHAFYQCGELVDISIPESVREVGAQAFRGCNKITVQDGGIYSFDGWIVYALPAATSAVITPSLKGIADDVFGACKAFDTVYFTGTEQEWKNIIIGSGNLPLTQATVIYGYEG